jgi:hypothetical protein
VDETEVVEDLYIKISIPTGGKPVQFAFGVDVPVMSWIFVQEKDGSFAPVTGLLALLPAGGARATWIQPGQTAWFQIRLQGWEALKVLELRKVVIGFSLVSSDADTLKSTTIFPSFVGRTYK